MRKIGRRTQAEEDKTFIKQFGLLDWKTKQIKIWPLVVFAT